MEHSIESSSSPSNLSALRANQQIQVVSFRVGNEEYGVDIMKVKEIIKVADIIPVPHSPDFVMGVMSLREQLLPIIDFEKKLGIQQVQNKNLADKRVVVIEIDGHRNGLLVDTVSQVLTLSSQVIEDPPQGVKDRSSEYLSGVAKLDQGARLIMILDAPKLISKSDKAVQDFISREPSEGSETLTRIESSEEIQMVCFKVNGQEYGIDIMQIREIIRFKQITTVPHSKSYIRGVINLRGTVIPVVDIRVLFSLPEGVWSDSSRIVVVINENEVLGLMVDSVTEVLRLSKSFVEESPIPASRPESQFVGGVAKLNHSERMIIIVDLMRLMSRQKAS